MTIKQQLFEGIQDALKKANSQIYDAFSVQYDGEFIIKKPSYLYDKIGDIIEVLEKLENMELDEFIECAELQ